MMCSKVCTQTGWERVGWQSVEYHRERLEIFYYGNDMQNYIPKLFAFAAN